MANSFEEIALDQSIVRKQWLPLDVAVREVLSFKNLFGPGHFLLACHAALPSLLTPELLHLIRLNFLDQQKPHTPWIAEMDFLLSPLCRLVEKDLFEVEPMVREALLFKLEERYGWQQLQNVADFLLQYTQKHHKNKKNVSVTQLHEWIAQAYLQPDKIVQELTHLLNESVDPQSNDYQKLPKKLRIARTTELLAEPLSHTMLQEEYAGLVHSARVLAYTLYGHKETLPTTIRPTDLAGEQKITLFPPAVQQWLSTVTISQKSGKIEPANTTIDTLGVPGEQVPIGTLFPPLHVEALLPLLHDPDATVRATAAHTLGTLEEYVPIAPLLPLLRDSHALVRKAAIDALGGRGELIPIEVLLSLLEDADEAVRQFAIDALEIQVEPISIEALLPLLANSDEAVRRFAIYALETQEEHIPIETLLSLRHDPYEDVRQFALKALETRVIPITDPAPLRYGPDDDVDDGSAFAPHVLEAQREPMPIDVLLPLLHDPDEIVRQSARRTLRAQSARMPIETLLSLLDDPDEDVKRVAIEALGALGERVPIDTFFPLLHDPDALVREAAVHALGAQGERVPIDTLLPLLHDSDAVVRQATIDALGTLGERTPIEALLPLLLDPDEIVRATAVDVLGAQGERTPIKALRPLLHDPDEDVRQAAVRALENIVHRLFSDWLTSQQSSRPTPFTDEQIRWLKRIRDRIITNGKFEERNFAYSPFEFDGGLVAARFLFGQELPVILRELNEALNWEPHSEDVIAAEADILTELPIEESILQPVDTLADQVKLGDMEETYTEPDSTHVELTPRELKVLRLFAQGLKSTQIAEQLVISVTTLNFHIRSIYSKLGVTSRTAATRYAIEHHLV